MPRSSKHERRYTNARERAQKQSMGFTAPYLKLPPDAKMFKAKAGSTMLLDIVPYVAGKGNPWAEEGATHYERTFYVHRGVGANNDSFLCPRMTKKGLRCPVCEFRMQLMKDAEEGKEEMIKDLAPKQRQLFNVINRKDPEAGVQLWDFSYHNFGKMLDARLRNSDEDEEWEKFFFLEGGFTLRVGFAEKSFGGHAFPDAESIDFKPREDLDEDIMEQVYDLDSLLVIPEYDELKKTFLEASPDKEKDTDDDDDDDAPKSKRGVKPAKSKKDDDDDDTDDDDDDAKDEDDTPKQKKKSPKDDDDWEDFDDDDDEPKAKSKKKTVVDDDDDDADTDDDDDEPQPKKNGKAVKKSKDEDDDDDDDLDLDDDTDDDDDDDDKNRGKSKKPKNRFAKQKGDKGWDTDDDDDDDVKPSKAKKKVKSSKDEDDD